MGLSNIQASENQTTISSSNNKIAPEYLERHLKIARGYLDSSFD
jgi:hypothetical protein